MNLREAGDPDRPLPGPRGAAGARRARRDAVDHRAARLAAPGRSRHRRRQLDESHRHPRALAARAGRRGPAQCQRARHARLGHRRRWNDRRGHWSTPMPETLEQIEARQRRRQAYELSARRVPRPPGHHRRRRGNQARGKHRGARRHGPGGRARRGRDRPVSIRIPARGVGPGGPDRRGAVSRVPPARRERRAQARDHPDLRHQRAPAPPGTPHDRQRAIAARDAWHQTQPGHRRGLSGAAARAAACRGRTVRCA